MTTRKQNMREKVRSYIKILTIVVVLVVIISYAYFETRELINGPEIDIKYPMDGLSVNQEIINITGKTKNASQLSLNGRPVFIDSAGNFSEKITLVMGYNSIFIEAKDRLGKTKFSNLNLILSSKENLP